jgi:hypothetical protein
MPAYLCRRQYFVFLRKEFEQTRIVLVTRVRLHRSCSLRALTAKAQVEVTDDLDMSAVLTSQDDAVQDLTNCVHNLILLSVEAFDVQTNPAMLDWIAT